jgi:4-diphosphocytidyl-2-C-methyl-D-erythritol kinase
VENCPGKMVLPGRKISLQAPAKINLFLRVQGRRDDGYHDLQTWMQKIDLCDIVELEVYSGGQIEFSTDDTAIPTDETNLAVRAAKAFFQVSKNSKGYGVKITLRKKIPVAAGLGGGSSDAGTVLRGLNDLFDCEFSEEQLIDLARPLGADVPFFAVDHDAVFATGIGDIMHPVDSVNNCWFVLVNPSFFVATAWVFQNLTLTSLSKNSKLSCFQKHQGTSFFLQDMHNDLEQVTSRRYPEIEEMKRALLACGACQVLMSGSGPTVFGVFPDSAMMSGSELKRIVGRLRQEYGENVFLARACTGASPSGKAPGFDPGIRRFESCRPSHH